MSVLKLASAVIILIVEDEPVVALDLSATVERQGHRVCAVAVSGEEAVKMAEVHCPDMVFMDYRLQGQLSGVQAAERMCDNLRSRIVFVTAQQDPATQAQIMASEPFGLIAKPFADSAIAEVLSRANACGQPS